jgi:hypothetical protein
MARDALGSGRRGARTLLARHGADTLTFLCLLGVSALVYAEFTDLYKVVALTGAVLDTRAAADQHSHALLVIGLGAGAAVLLARLTDSPLPALAAAALGIVALAITLIGDLPDVTSSGLVSGGEPAEAQPAAGFWLELVGALLVTAGALGLARALTVARSRRRQRGARRQM